MCGLCHALGDGYGLPHRLVTGYDAILLNLLISAQQTDAPDVVMRRCPLNPLMRVRTNQNEASDFAAAAAMALAFASADDHVQDSGGHDLAARAARFALKPANDRALITLESFGFDAASFSRLTETQSQAESETGQDAEQPTALITARLFAASARVAGSPQNAEPLAAVGAAYGAYLYLSDAYQDLAKDLARGDFNPLRPYADEAAHLNAAGQRWLLARLERIAAALREQLPRVTLHRDRALVVRLLTEPLHKLIDHLNGRAATHVCQSCAKPVPIAADAASAINVPLVRIEGGGTGESPLQIKRRKQTNDPCSDCCDACSSTSGTHHTSCCDCCHIRCCNPCACCDGNPNTQCCDCQCSGQDCCSCCNCCDGNCCDGNCCDGCDCGN